MIPQISDSELRSQCKRKIESLELWLRRLIDQVLTASYGNYFDHVDEAGSRLISARITTPLGECVAREPERYSRPTDAVLLDDSISIICNPTLYHHFRPALEMAFPEGCFEARTFLGRLIEPRNRLAHANPIRLRDAERIFCYSGDVIESISCFYKQNNMNQDFNVPLFIRFTDSLGSTYHRDQLQAFPGGGVGRMFNLEPQFDLRSGDTLTVEVEVDPTFSSESYSLTWSSPNGLPHPFSTGPKAVVVLTPKQVGEQFMLRCRLKTTNDWHRNTGDNDDMLTLCYRVLPPP